MKQFPLATRHTISFVLLIAIPTLLVIIMLSNTFRLDLIEKTRHERHVLMEQTANSLNQAFETYSIMAASIIHNKEIMENAVLYYNAETADQEYLYSKNLDTEFEKFLQMTKLLTSIYLYFTDNSSYFFRNYSIGNFSQQIIDSFREISIKKQGSIQFIETFADGSYGNSDRSVLSIIVSPSTNNEIEMLLLAFDMPQINEFLLLNLDTASSNYQNRRFIINQDGKVIASSHTELVNQYYDNIKTSSNKRVFYIDKKLNTSGWTIVEEVDSRELTKTVDRLMLYVYIALFSMIVLFAFYNFSFFNRIISPLHNANKNMKQVAKGDFTVRLPAYDRFPEFNNLSTTFNSMVQEVDSLTAKIVSKEKERTKIEIEALRFQLNPHFLCNTLNSIKIMSSIAKVESIEKMTASLMRVMEDNLSGNDTTWTLEHELKNLENYVYIMKVRFGSTFDFFCDIEKELLKRGIPSMTLQPIVENAIIHGVHGMETKGIITVAGRIENNMLVIEVRDNGKGINDTIIKTLFDVPKHSNRGLNGIGLYNVRRRIVLAYGRPYDIEVSSFPGAGTIVTTYLPLLKAETI